MDRDFSSETGSGPKTQAFAAENRRFRRPDERHWPLPDTRKREVNHGISPQVPARLVLVVTQLGLAAAV
jgi:hypothetical protein